MLSFWDAWRKAGKRPLPWRESLRTARAKPKPPAPKKLGPPMSDHEWLTRIGVTSPEKSS